MLIAHFVFFLFSLSTGWKKNVQTKWILQVKRWVKKKKKKMKSWQEWFVVLCVLGLDSNELIIVVAVGWLVGSLLHYCCLREDALLYFADDDDFDDFFHDNCDNTNVTRLINI